MEGNVGSGKEIWRLPAHAEGLWQKQDQRVRPDPSPLLTVPQTLLKMSSILRDISLNSWNYLPNPALVDFTNFPSMVVHQPPQVEAFPAAMGT